MTKGHEIFVMLGNTAIAASRSCSVQLNQEVEECAALPGTTNDDGWLRFKHGQLSWSVTNDAFFATDNSSLMDKIVSNNEKVELRVGLDGVNKYLKGDALLTEMSIQGDNGSMAKCTLKFACNNFPTIITEQ